MRRSTPDQFIRLRIKFCAGQASTTAASLAANAAQKVTTMDSLHTPSEEQLAKDREAIAIKVVEKLCSFSPERIAEVRQLAEDLKLIQEQSPSEDEMLSLQRYVDNLRFLQENAENEPNEAARESLQKHVDNMQFAIENAESLPES